ncbi:MAG: isoaspartyl peptidase/L-asparaginase [candidate division WOR-3 bacterium]
MQNRSVAIICHGGAGVHQDKPAAAEGLKEALETAYRLLLQSAYALEVVVEAVRILEDNPLFNAGTGSSLTIDGRVEMDASVMTQDGRFGAVGAISEVRNPILVAQKVMTETDHLLLCDAGAVQFARKMGFEPYDPTTEKARQKLNLVLEQGSPYFPKMKQLLNRSASIAEPEQTGLSGSGTVGAVAIDKHGNLAAATSSGGIAGRLRGRVGDSAILGAGTYAAPSGAVSCSGHGEEIMRRLLAKDIVDRMATLPATTALTLALAEAKRKKVRCGAIGIDAKGTICYGQTTPDFAWGYKVADRLFLFTDSNR